mgnify:CR=1 FL=1
MKNLMFLCAVILAISFTSCGGNKTELVPENKIETEYELQSTIGKGDSQTSEGDGGATHTMDED